MTLIEEGKIQIHTENIFPIIKKAVYSDHEIFLREIISNSVDAINKRRMASMANDCEEGDEGKVEICIDKELKTIKISDNGIGMTADEVKKYINQVAFSSAEEFLQKYQKTEEGIIGHFGLGFYSSFMVSSKVELITKSAKKDSQAIKWNCDGSPNFSLENTDRETAGTDVILHLLQEEEEYLEPSRIKNLVSKYCDFMPVQILMDSEKVNKMNPPWRRIQQEMKDNDYIEFYKYLYPFQGDPLFWVHLNTDYPFNLQAILFFPKITGRADWEKGEIKLYSNQVYVSDSIKEIVPNYLLPLRGVIDSTDIPLNVSRSALQTDRRVRSIGNFISKKIGDKLKDILREDPSFYTDIWSSIAPFIKIGAMEDEKFAAQVEDLIIFKTSLDNKEENSVIVSKEGKYYSTIKGYLERNTSDNKRVIYCTDEVSQANALQLWKSQGNEIIFTDNVIDTQFISWLESKEEHLKFQRVDSELDDHLKEEEAEIVDKDGESNSEILRKIFKDALNNDKVTIQIQSLKGTSSCPSMILLPEQMRRINDIGAIMNQQLPALPENHVLVINKNHDLVKGLLKLKPSTIITGNEGQSPSEVLSHEIAKHLYEMAKLSVGGLDPNGIGDFQSRNAELMGKLINKAF